jgi:hypothetical protein
MAPTRFPDWQNAVHAMLAAGLLLRGDVTPALAALAVAPPLGNRFALALTPARIHRLLAACPCLYTQVAMTATAEATVHLCEITLGARIMSVNVSDAFRVQYPPAFRISPQQNCTNAGAISEALCAEVLTNEGLPRMPVLNGRVNWTTPGFIDLNRGPLSELRSFGDYLVPAAPSNIIISCKTQAARERLLNSGIRVDTVGFGFMDNPAEFWTSGKMNTLRRFGFTAIYLPTDTYEAIHLRLQQQNRATENVNVNGKALYRPLAAFGPDMLNVCGGTSLAL